MGRFYKIHLWKNAPFFRLLIPLLAGILLQFYFPFSLTIIVNCGCLFLALFVVISQFSTSVQFFLKSFRGLALHLFIVSLGMFLTLGKDVRTDPTWYGHFDRNNKMMIAIINEPPVLKAKSYKALARVITLTDGRTTKPISGDIIMYFTKDSLSQMLRFGDCILINKSLQTINNTGNPGGFDYASYLAKQQVYHQVFLQSDDWKRIPKRAENIFRSFIYASRDKVLEVLDRYIIGENEKALAKALLIGYRVDLDRDLVKAYSNAGVVHLIAISGLHLGLIYALLLWVTAVISRLKKFRIARVILILIGLWFFALLTGAPPSVMRAAVMFSFISIGTLLGKRSSIYNSLSASAFFLLCFDPYIFWDVGFQLSYLAVIGIVTLQKSIYQWFYSKNIIVDYCWQLASVSIAAQMFTIPICFFYFHQLPLLFLLANLIAIPLSFLALWGCVVLIAISAIALLSEFLGTVLTGILWMMNHAVIWVNKIPFLLWKNVNLTIFETLLLYSIFISIFYWLLNKNKTALKLALFFSLTYSLLFSYGQFEVKRQKKLVVYNVTGHWGMDFIKGKYYAFHSNENLKKDQSLMQFNIIPTRVFYGATHALPPQQDLLNKNMYWFEGKRILVYDSAKKYVPGKKIPIDYLIISGNPKIKMHELLQNFECGLFIFAANNSLWRIGEWKKECEELNLRFHTVSEEGAYVSDL